MDINCNKCKAQFEIELIKCNKKLKFTYYCIFCENKLLEINDNRKFIPKDIKNYPILKIAVPGLIYSILNNYMNEYKDLFEELSIKKGQANSNLDITFDKDEFTSEGWSYLQLDGKIKNIHEVERKTLEDFFKTPNICIAIYFLHNSKQVQTQTIVIPYILKPKNIEGKIISLIYDVCKILNYRLFIVDMGENLYNNYLERGAILIDEDSVEITENTNLLI